MATALRAGHSVWGMDLELPFKDQLETGDTLRKFHTPLQQSTNWTTTLLPVTRNGSRDDTITQRQLETSLNKEDSPKETRDGTTSMEI